MRRDRRLRLEVDAGEGGLALQLLLPEERQRYRGRIHALQVGQRGVDRRVRIEGVDAHQPRSLARFGHEGDGLLGAPGRLVVFGSDPRATMPGHVPGASRLALQVRVVRYIPVHALIREPLLVIVLCRGPEGLRLRMVAPFEHPIAVAVLRHLLHATVCRRQVQLTGEARVIARIA